MKTVKHELFVNRTQTYVNDFLSHIPAEDIVNVSFHTATFENNTDEYVSIFYKSEE
jgi:hypothetical protein